MKHLFITSISCAIVLLAGVLPAAAQGPVSGGEPVDVNLPQIESQIPANFRNLPGIIARIFTVTITAAGGIFVIMLLFGGVEYLTGAGNEEATKKGKARMIDATIGIVITLSAWAIGTFVLNQFYKGGSPTGKPTNTTQRGGASRRQPITFSVQVSDSTGNPVNGASVSVNNNLKGRTVDGKLSFQVTQGAGSYTLGVSASSCRPYSERIFMADQSFVEVTLTNCVD